MCMLCLDNIDSGIRDFQKQEDVYKRVVDNLMLSEYISKAELVNVSSKMIIDTKYLPENEKNFDDVDVVLWITLIRESETCESEGIFKSEWLTNWC